MARRSPGRTSPPSGVGAQLEAAAEPRVERLDSRYWLISRRPVAAKGATGPGLVLWTTPHWRQAEGSQRAGART
jgi:hypothetical protein